MAQTPIILLVYILTVNIGAGVDSGTQSVESVRQSWVCRLAMLESVVYIIIQIINNYSHKFVSLSTQHCCLSAKHEKKTQNAQ